MLASGRRVYPFGVSHRLRAEVKGNAAVLMVNEAVVHVDTVTAEPGATRAGLASGSAYSFTAYNFRVWATPAAGDGTEHDGHLFGFLALGLDRVFDPLVAAEGSERLNCPALNDR